MNRIVTTTFPMCDRKSGQQDLSENNWYAYDSNCLLLQIGSSLYGKHMEITHYFDYLIIEY